jgi:CRISPR-associated endonuclease Cas2
MSPRSSERIAAEGTKEVLLDILQLVLNQAPIDRRYAKKLYYLRQEKYIRKQGGKDRLTLKGQQTLSERVLWELAIPKPKRWDGKWRVVLFDIPKDKRKRRDIFRTHLKELGLLLYQNSVWIYPYSLEKQVLQIADFHKLSGCVSFITAETISDEKYYLQKFGLL